MIDPQKTRWGRHFSAAEIEEARSNGRLLTMEIETSHVCNLRCIYCYNSSGEKKGNELRLDEIQNVIEQGIDLGVRRVIVIGGGEPMMYPDVMEIIKFLYQRGIGIDLFTNGTLLTEESAKTLYDYGVEVVVKLNSLRKEMQDFLADRAGTYDAIRRGLDFLMQAGYPDASHELGIETIICSHNYDEMAEMWRWARDRDIIPYFEMVTFQGRARQRHELNVSVGDLKRLFHLLAKIDREEYDCIWEPHPPIAALSCSRHEYSCTIDSRGYVYPCTGVDIRIGSVRHEGLREILNNSVVIQSLRNIRQNVKGACRTCDQLCTCYGCRGMAYHWTGDYLAADPLCWRNPEHIKNDGERGM